MSQPTLPECSKRHRAFNGTVEFYKHRSTSCPDEMRFSVFRPDGQSEERFPLLYWLSGLTCTEENFMVKSGIQRLASQERVLIVAPDTSPRGANLPGEDDSYDFGTGAGFYVNATQEPWSRYYNMYSYVTEELPSIIDAHFPTNGRQGIFGHSMGGHGALICALKNPDRYASVSAFSPIVSPTQCPWGTKAFTNYLGDKKETWKDYDATELVDSKGSSFDILVDQGCDDEFLEEQLKPQLFEQACNENKVRLTLNHRKGFDHSFYFVSSFLEDHMRHHLRFLR